MKYSIVAVAFAALASAQSIQDIPSCARPCLEDSIKKNTQCAVEDLSCVCKNFNSIQGDATGCVVKACGPDTAINQVLPAASKLCANPPAAGGAASSAPAAASSAPAAASSAPAAASSAPAAASSAPAAASSAAGAASSSVAPVPMPTIVTTPSAVVPPTSAKPTATPVPTAGAAALGSMGGLAALVLGALAL